MYTQPPVAGLPTPGPIEVSGIDLPQSSPVTFSSVFRIGRDPACAVCIRNEYVSRNHAEISPERDGWRVRDLNSSNGIYWQGQRVDTVLVTSNETIRLGIAGPEVSFQVHRPPPPPPPKPVAAESTRREPPAAPPDGKDMEQYVQRYFRAPVEGEVVGEHTRYIRRAFAQIQTEQNQVFAQIQSEQKKKHTRQRRVLLVTIGVLAVIGIAIGGYAYRLHVEARRQREIARNLFYAMKSVDVEIAEAERQALASGDKQAGIEAVNKYEAQRKGIQANYDRFLATLKIYDPKTTEQHRLILRIARVFGETEVDMPPDFENEVVRYIKYWQSTGRFARDIRTAQEKGFVRTIPEALLNRGLPVQFFYLAMQESDFDPYRSGPLTRKGYAKGMWQFIPETGIKYGLHLGPLVDLGRPDPADERDQADKETDAATRYIQVLYSTDAQASGLLVMACYNWGENQVLPLVRSMPLNPGERNFWRLLAQHRSQIPQETYDYVFYITSAAVIGENPRLFGFDFDNPLDNAR